MLGSSAYEQQHYFSNSSAHTMRRITPLRLFASAALVVVISTGAVGSAVQPVDAASTITVTSLGDTTNASDGLLTLREAIASAASGDTINFDSSLFTSGPQVIEPLSTISIPTTMNIIGPGQNLLTIRGTRETATMVSYSRTSNVVTATMSGPIPFAASGVVFFYGSSVFTLAKNFTNGSGNTFTFSNTGPDVGTTSATATVAGTTGGAYRAFTFSGTLTIKDLTIDKFMAERGGAFAQGGNGARLIAERVKFTNNVGYGNYCGGAINANRGWVSVIDSTFNANVARCASAIQMGDGSGSSLSVSGSTFTNNIAESSTILSYLPMTFVNSSMSGSKSLSNGEMTGINMGSFAMPFTMTNSIVSDPVIIENNSRVIITGSTLSSLSIAHAFAKLENNDITSCSVNSTTAVDVSSGNNIGNASGCSVVSGTGAAIQSYSRTSNVLTLTTTTPHGLQVGDTVRQCGIQALALVVWSWCHLTGTVTSVTSTTVSFADARGDVASTLVYSSEPDRAAYVFSNVPYSLPQTVTWSPSTSLSLANSSHTPSSMATTSGNGAISYAVTSAGTTGCTVGSSTGVLTYTAAGSCTVRATAASTAQWGSGSVSVTFVISGSSSTSTTTSTTTPSSATTAAGSSATTVADGSGASSGQSSVSTIPSGRTITTEANPLVTPSGSATTTIPASATTTVPVPKAPTVKLGEAAAIIDGETISATLSRVNNQITATAGDISTTISGLTPDGQRVALNDEGNLVLNEGDKIVVEASGVAPDEDVAVWMFSTPTKLGVIAADASGKIAGTFNLPNGIESGEHRVVLSGTNRNGTNVVLGIGLSYGAVNSGSTLTRVLIAIPIALAVLFGFFLPAVSRRRRKAVAA